VDPFWSEIAGSVICIRTIATLLCEVPPRPLTRWRRERFSGIALRVVKRAGHVNLHVGILVQMRRFHPALLLGWGCALFLALFYFVPLIAILARGLDAGALLAVFDNPYYRERIGFTFYQAVLSTLLTVAAALPAALLFGRFDFPGKGLLRALFTVPFVMPTIVAAVGFLALLGPRSILGVDLSGSLAIVLLAHVFYNYAVVVRVVGSYLEAVAPRVREAAQTLGAPAWRTVWTVDLPLARPALLAAASLVFVFTFTSFGVILVLAPGLATLEVEIYRLTSRLLRLDAAAVLVLAQLAINALVTLWYVGRQRRLAVSLGGSGISLPRPAGATRVLVALVLIASFVAVLAPLGALVVHAFWLPGSDAPSLLGFRELLEQPRTVAFTGVGTAVRNSLFFAFGSMLLSLVVGFGFAYAVVRANWHWLDLLSMLPLATSAVSLGFGYLITYPALTATPWGLLLAHTLVAFPFVTRALLPALRGLPRSYTDAALTLGASPWAVLGRVELPLLRPALTTAAAFAFAVSMGEFGASVVLSRPDLATIPVAIFDRLGRPGITSYASALALSVILMVVTAASLLLLDRRNRTDF